MRLDTPVSGGAGQAAGAHLRVTHLEVADDPSWGSLCSLLRDGTDGQRYPLEGEWVEIGRTGADLTFDDRHLARRHARFELFEGRPRVVPLDPLNGVFCRLRSPTRVEDGEVILCGRELLRFEAITEEERAVPPLLRHGVAMFGSPARAAWGRLVQLLASGGVLDVRHLVADEIVLGREEGDVVFRDDEFLSRRHAAFRFRDGGCEVEDLGSSNGTFVRLRGPLELQSGDQLRIGDQMFRFELRDR